MSAKTSFVILLTAMLLATSANRTNWQGTGNMNSSVIAKIWDNLENNLNAAIGSQSIQATNAFVKDISDRLGA